MSKNSVNSKIVRRIALIVLGSTLLVAVIAIVAGRSTLFQLSGLAEDERVIEALIDNQKTIVDLYRERQALVEPVIRECLERHDGTCPHILTDVDVTNLGEGRSVGWTSEETYVGVTPDGSRYQYSFHWQPLKPKYETLQGILASRVHLSAVLPEITNTFLLVFSFALFASVLLGLGMSFLFGRKIALRVNKLTDYTKTIGRGILVPAPRETLGPDEIGLLARAMQRMAGDLATAQNKLLVTEKMASWQTVARKVAHEIKNPLTPISLVASELKQRSQKCDPKLRRFLEEAGMILEEETHSLGRMVHEFSSFARLPEPQLESIDLREVIDSFLKKNPEESVEWQPEVEQAVVVADRAMIWQVLHNLVNNAKTAKKSGPPHLRLHLRGDDRSYYVDVTDDAGGVPQELRQSLFDAYVTSRSTGDAEKGMGLGLAISRKILVDHGGSLTLLRSDEVGSTFRFTLPKSSVGDSINE